MNKSLNIIEAWDASVWSDPAISAITPNVFRYDVLASIREADEAIQLLDQGIMNFFTLTVTRTRNTKELRGNMGTTLFSFDVEVAYHLEKDTSVDSTNFNQAVAVIEVLDEIVLTALGANWGGTISYYEQSGILKPKLIQIDERDVWQCGYSYTAVKSV